MTKFTTLKDALTGLSFIFRPSYWLMLYPYSDAWDRKLNELLDTHQFEPIRNPLGVCQFRAKLGDLTLWVENRPYATMNPNDGYGTELKVRAKRSTIARAVAAYEQSVKQESEKLIESL